MTPRTLVFLAIATLLFTAGAIVVNSESPAFNHSTGGGLLFPGFAGKINDAAKIVIESSGKKFTIERKGANWVVADKYGFPAKYDLVKGTLVALAQLRTLDAKTSQPSLYPRLEVSDPSSKDAKSSEITVEDAKGAVLASLILGKTRMPLGGESNATEIYVRKPSEARSWLATGNLQRNDDIKTWMARDIVTLDSNRVQSVAVTPTAAEAKSLAAKAAGAKTPAPVDDRAYTLVKAKPGDGDFTLEQVPADEKVKSSFDVNQIGEALSALIADDVLPAKDLAPDATLLRTLDYKSFDGAVIDLSLYRQGDKTWIKIAAGVEPKVAAEAARTKAESKAGTKMPAKAPAAADESGSTKLETPFQVADDMQALAARAKDWLFALNGSDLSTLEKSFSDLVEAKEAAKPKS